MKHPVQAARTPRSAIFLINLRFLWALLCGAVAWLYWPSDPRWWQFGILSGIMALALRAILIGTLRMMFRVYARDREIAAIMAQGRTAHSSELVGSDALKRAGMTDD